MKIRHFIMAVGMVLTSFLPCSATDIFFQTIDAKDGLADNFVRDKKLMAITGKSPLEFFRIVKLKRGKSLLDQGRTNISEVSDMMGLSAKQFTHYFKLMYNHTPSEYLKKNHH